MRRDFSTNWICSESMRLTAFLRRFIIISHSKDSVSQPLLERRIIAELLEQFRVVGQ